MKTIKAMSLFAAVWLLSTGPVHATLPDPILPDWVSATSVGEQIRHNGVDMKIVYFTTAKPIPAVIDHYRSAWSKADNPPVENQVGDWQVVGYQEGEFYYTVQVRPSGTGTTSEGMVAVTSLPSSTPIVASSLPRLPGSLLLSVTDSVDDGRDAQTVVLENESSLQSNLDFYRSQMPGEGWSIQQDRAVDGDMQETKRVLFMTRDNVICQMALMRVAPGKTHVVATISTSHR